MEASGVAPDERIGRFHRDPIVPATRLVYIRDLDHRGIAGDFPGRHRPSRPAVLRPLQNRGRSRQAGLDGQPGAEPNGWARLNNPIGTLPTAIAEPPSGSIRDPVDPCEGIRWALEAVHGAGSGGPSGMVVEGESPRTPACGNPCSTPGCFRRKTRTPGRVSTRSDPRVPLQYRRQARGDSRAVSVKGGEGPVSSTGSDRRLVSGVPREGNCADPEDPGTASLSGRSRGVAQYTPSTMVFSIAPNGRTSPTPSQA